MSKDGFARHETQNYLRDARAAGIEFVQISPIRDDFIDEMDADWLAARPNTDTAVMLGLAHTLAAEGLHNPDFLARYCTGFDRFRAYLTGETGFTSMRAPERTSYAGDYDHLARYGEWALTDRAIPQKVGNHG